jgi:hypothetical protein
VLNKFLTALLLIGGASALHAGPVYSCGGGSACDGNLYAVWVASQTATSYVLDVSIQVTNNYLTSNGGPGSNMDYLSALAVIPDNEGSFTNASMTGHPGGIWSLQTGGLAASGCTGSGATFICAGATSPASLFSSVTPNTLTFQFLITGAPPSLGDTAHIKYLYKSYLGTKVGDLGSFDVAIQCIGGNGCDASTTPEPVTSALVGGGLIGLYFLRRRLPGAR